MSAYDNDPRVRQIGEGRYEVKVRSDVNAFGEVCPALFGGYVAGIVGQEWTGLGFATADEAIRSLIGEPQ